MIQRPLAALIVLWAISFGVWGFVDVVGAVRFVDPVTALIGGIQLWMGWKGCQLGVRLWRRRKFLWDAVRGEPRWMRVVGVILLYGEFLSLTWILGLTVAGLPEALVPLAGSWLLMSAPTALLLMGWYAVRKVVSGESRNSAG